MASHISMRSLRGLGLRHNGPARIRKHSFTTSRPSSAESQTTAAAVAGLPPRKPSRIRNILIGTGIVLGGGLAYFYVTDTRSTAHRWLTVPLIRIIWPDAEDAHHGGVRVLKELYHFGLHPRERGPVSGDLEIEVFGQPLSSPLGISSGLDKNGEIVDALLAIAPLVEIGGVTLHPQNGNPKPRVFRIPSQEAMINRYGLNSDGAEMVASRLRHRLRDFAHHHGYGLDAAAERFVLSGGAGVPPGSLTPGKLLAVQVAKSSNIAETDIEAIRADYAESTTLLAPYADIVVVNVSCPNVHGTRELQQIEPLTRILTGVVRAADSSSAAAHRPTRPAVMVKVSPDEDTDEQVASICAAVWAAGVDGVVVGNTTRRRPSPLPGTTLTETEAAALREHGGFSGPSLFPGTLRLVKKYRRILDYPLQDRFLAEQADQPDQSPLGPDAASRTPKIIFCTGGISDGRQALQVREAGAAVAQIYTALVYGGVGKITAMKAEMREELARQAKKTT